MGKNRHDWHSLISLCPTLSRHRLIRVTMGVYMGKNRHDRHSGKIKGDTATDTVLKFLSCDTSISYHATLRHEHKIWDPYVGLYPLLYYI